MGVLRWSPTRVHIKDISIISRKYSLLFIIDSIVDRLFLLSRVAFLILQQVRSPDIKMVGIEKSFKPILTRSSGSDPESLNEMLNREGNSLAAEQNSIASLGLKLKRDFKRFAK